MNQSTIIFGYLFAAFLIFITQRGELPIYWGLLVKSPQTPSSGPTASGSGAVSGSSKSASNNANQDAQYAQLAIEGVQTAAMFA